MSLAIQQPLPGIQPSTKELSPMQMIQVAFNAAIEQGKGLEVIDRILEQQKWMIQHDEEERFNAALKRIQMHLKKIPKRGWNEQTKSYFALAQDIDDAIQSLLDAEQMTLSFKPAVSERENEVLIIGTLSLGAYCREYPLPMPADGKGPQGGGVMSRTHATGSAITYGKRYLKDMIFDLRFEDPRYKKLEDDGNAAGNTEAALTQEQSAKLNDWADAIEQAPDLPRLKNVFADAHAYAKGIGAKYSSKMDQFFEARKRALMGGGR